MNRFQATAHLVELKPLRYTPAGIPALDVLLEHKSETLNEHDATVEFSALAFGMTAQSLQKVALGSLMRIDGFLRPVGKSKKLAVQIETFQTLQTVQDTVQTSS